MDLIKNAFKIASDPKQSQWIAPLLVAGDAVLCGLIIWKIPCKQSNSFEKAGFRTDGTNAFGIDTEIDWVAYMQQIDIYLKGTRNYYLIEGDTGPLVYPGLHVYIYRVLHAITGGGKNILLAQGIFAMLYLATLAVVMACYRRAKVRCSMAFRSPESLIWSLQVPPYIFPLLVLSKRLHSIYMLRLFNDCFAVLFLWVAMYALQRKQWVVGTGLLSCGIGVKMSVLLSLPGVAFVLLQGIGLERCITMAMLVAQTQVR